MKIKDIHNLINETLYNEVKNNIINESNEMKKEVYHIKCEGIPLATFETEKEAKEHLPKLKAKHKGGELIIEKGIYESHHDMIEKLDELNDQLEEENTDTNMKNIEQTEGNAFIDALNKAKQKGEKTFEVDGETYDVKECLDEMEMSEEEECNECGDKDMEEEEKENVCNECGKPLNEEGLCTECGGLNEEEEECHECGDKYMEEEKTVCDECGKELNEEGVCNECSGLMWETEDQGLGDDESKDDESVNQPTDEPDVQTPEVEPSDEKKSPIIKKPEFRKGVDFGSYDLKTFAKKSNLKDFFINESKNKKIRLTETEFKKLLKNIVNEAMKGQPGIPGIPGVTVTKKAQSDSKKENDGHIKDTEKKMKDYLSFDGNDNPEFPKQIGKGEKMAINNTEKQEEEKDKNFAGLQNLDYDTEPSENFKKRLKMAIEGDSKMGNAASKEVVKIDEKDKKGKQPEEKLANTIDNPNAIKKLEKQIKNRKSDKDKRALYRKQSVPVSHDTGKDEVNESNKDNQNILNEEIVKIKRLSNYNQKTQ